MNTSYTNTAALTMVADFPVIEGFLNEAVGLIDDELTQIEAEIANLEQANAGLLANIATWQREPEPSADKVAKGASSPGAKIAAARATISENNAKISSLNTGLKNLIDARNETVQYVNDLVTRLTNCDQTSAQDMNDIFGLISDYRNKMMDFGDVFGEGVNPFGIGGTDRQQKFNDTIKSLVGTSVETMPFVSASSLYGRGILNDWALDAIWGKDVSTVAEQQYVELGTLMGNIIARGDLKSVEKFIEGAYYSIGGDSRTLTEWQRLSPVFGGFARAFENQSVKGLLSHLGADLSELDRSHWLPVQFSTLFNEMLKYPVVSLRTEPMGGNPDFSLNWVNYLGNGGGALDLQLQLKNGDFDDYLGLTTLTALGLQENFSNALDEISDLSKSDNLDANTPITIVGSILVDYLIAIGLSGMPYGEVKALQEAGDAREQLKYEISIGRAALLYNALKTGGFLVVTNQGRISIGMGIMDIHGTNGAGFASMAYEHYTGKPFDLGQLGQTLQGSGPAATYDQYKDFLSWAANHGDDLADYQTALGAIAGKDITSFSYEELKALAEQYENAQP